MINTLKNYTYEELQEWAVEQGLKPFVGRQIFEWIFAKGVNNTDEMLNISKKARELIDAQGSLAVLEVSKHEISEEDSSEKFLFTCHDGHSIETVLLHSGNHFTLCISSEVGCAMGCVFCKTGEMGLVRKLETAEILEQFIQVQRISSQKISNIVFMGMGEPFNNYDAVIKAAEILNHHKGPNIGARHITLSTSGIVPRIKEFAHLPFQFKLAVSLNSADNAKRSELMPLNRRYPLEELLSAATYYTHVTNKLIFFEYVLLKGINDSLRDAYDLIEKLNRIPCKLNVIPYNETDSKFNRPDDKDIKKFVSYFKDTSFPVTLRYSGGRGIKAACGQLYHETIKNDPIL